MGNQASGGGGSGGSRRLPDTPFRAVALLGHDGNADSNELTFAKGDELDVLRVTGGDFWLASIGNGTPGWAPARCLRPLTRDAQKKREKEKQKQQQQQQQQQPQQQPQQPQKAGDEGAGAGAAAAPTDVDPALLPHRDVDRDFVAESDGEVSIVRGETVVVFETSSNGWSRVRTPQGREGWVPSDFLVEPSAASAAAAAGSNPFHPPPAPQHQQQQHLHQSQRLGNVPGGTADFGTYGSGQMSSSAQGAAALAAASLPPLTLDSGRQGEDVTAMRTALEDQIAHLRMRVSELEEENVRLQAEVTAARRDAQAEVESMRAKLQHSADTVPLLSRQLKQMQDEMGELRARVDVLRTVTSTQHTAIQQQQQAQQQLQAVAQTQPQSKSGAATSPEQPQALGASLYASSSAPAAAAAAAAGGPTSYGLAPALTSGYGPTPSASLALSRTLSQQPQSAAASAAAPLPASSRYATGSSSSAAGSAVAPLPSPRGNYGLDTATGMPTLASHPSASASGAAGLGRSLYSSSLSQSALPSGLAASARAPAATPSSTYGLGLSGIGGTQRLPYSSTPALASESLPEPPRRPPPRRPPFN